MNQRKPRAWGFGKVSGLFHSGKNTPYHCLLDLPATFALTRADEKDILRVSLAKEANSSDEPNRRNRKQALYRRRAGSHLRHRAM